MIRVVLDTNVVVSANLVDEGPSAAILDLAAHRKILMFVSAPILAEYEAVLRRPRLKLSPGAVRGSLATIRRTSKLVKPRRTIREIKDEPDNRFLECAVAARADYLITGNARHFPGRFEGVRIVTPREFLEIIAPQLLITS